MLKGKRLQSGKYLVELDSGRKGKRRNKKPPSDTLSSLEKIQLHINRALGRPTPKTLPKLTDEEYLVLQSKMTSLKNVKIGRSDFGIGQSNTFATPVMETNTSYPSVPQGLAVPLPAQITQGYDIVNGNIIPAPLPSRLDAIQTGNAGRQVNAPEQQNPNRPSFEVMRPPEEGILNRRVISRDTFDRENTRQRQEQLLALSKAMREPQYFERDATTQTAIPAPSKEVRERMKRAIGKKTKEEGAGSNSPVREESVYDMLTRAEREERQRERELDDILNEDRDVVEGEQRLRSPDETEDEFRARMMRTFEAMKDRRTVEGEFDA